MKITGADVKASYNAEKKASDRSFHYWSYLVVRPISFPVAAFCINRGWRPTTVTIGGFFILLAALALLQFSDLFPAGVVIAAILINFWVISDAVDGNVARFCKNGSAYGAFVDWVTGHIYHMCVPIFVGIAIVRTGHYRIFTENLAANAIYIGLIYALIEASRTAMSSRSRRAQPVGVALTSKGEAADRTRLAPFLAYAFGSFSSPVLLVAAIFQALDVWLGIYTVYAGVIWLAILREGLKINRIVDRLGKV